MANIPSVPPLFCNTPPPIDFGDEEDDDTALPPALTLDEEDDEYGEFTAASQAIDDGKNTDVPSLPRTPVPFENLSSATTTTTSGFGDDHPSFEDKAFATSAPSPIKNHINQDAPGVKTVEAFNMVMSPAILDGSSPPPLDLDTTITEDDYVTDNVDDFQEFCAAPLDKDPDSNALELSEDEESGTKNEDNISLPSLKFDTLSICSEKHSESSPQSLSPSMPDEDMRAGHKVKTVEQDQTKEDNEALSTGSDTPQTDVPSNTVVLEDLIDDSSDDESYSPKKVKSLKTDETSADFFAIQAINEEQQEEVLTVTRKNSTAGPESQSTNNTVEISFEKGSEPTEEVDFDDFTSFADFQSSCNPPVMDNEVLKTTHQLQLPNQEFVFDADFSQFGTTDSNLVNKSDTLEDQTFPLETNNEIPNNLDDDDDEFDDFQDFSPAPVAASANCAEETKKGSPPMEESIGESFVAGGEEICTDSDDEFGDFSEAAIVPSDNKASTVSSVATNIPSDATPIISINNLSSKLKPILDMMFPSTSVEELSPDNTTETRENFEKSSKSLKLESIDAAKALEYQWINSEVRHSLIKSLGIDSRNILFGEKWNSSMPRFAANLSFNPLEPLKPQPVSHSTSETLHSNSQETSANSIRTEVPAVEFDWNSSGLVNPLDGPKENVTHARETETLHPSQPGQLNAPVDQQQSHTAIEKGDGDTADDTDINARTAPSAVFNTTAATAISSIISTDCIGNNVDANSDNIDISVGPTPSTSDQPLANIPSTTTAIIHNPGVLEPQSYQPSTFTTENVFGNSKETDIDNDEVVTTSTFAGPLKETHIYTPSKSECAISKTTTLTKTSPIDFDYEIAAAGIIIDETVVKKEYRDVEYNPGFSLEFNRTQQNDFMGSDKPSLNNFFGTVSSGEGLQDVNGSSLSKDTLSKSPIAPDNSDFDDEFTDFQSVPPQPQTTAISQAPPHLSAAVMRGKEAPSPSRTCTPTFGGSEMILSPAILLPQAISIESNKPKIEWGDTTANINPDELARIEELFPQPKTVKSPADGSRSQKASPTNNGYQQQKQNSLSISATIAQKELSVANDDDDWSEFVSVPVPEATNAVKPKTQTTATVNHHNNNNNNNHNHLTQFVQKNGSLNMSPNHRRAPQQRQTPMASPQKSKTSESTSTSNDEEWSDFVSSSPAPVSASQFRAAPIAAPQFNSAAWQNANFYNNPLSFYQSQSQPNVVPNVSATSKLQNNNSTPSNYNNNYNQYYMQQNLQQQQQQQQLQLQQQIHIMQNFSTAPPYRISQGSHMATNATTNTLNNSQFQLGSAKVAPSISLIPDLGFVAPAAPTHTAFINSLPKPSFSTKK